VKPQIKVKPLRSKKRREWISTLPCCICGALSGDNYRADGSWCPANIAHHPYTGGGSTKCCDSLCVPLCFFCHEGMNNKRKDDIPLLDEIIAELQSEWEGRK